MNREFRGVRRPDRRTPLGIALSAAIALGGAAFVLSPERAASGSAGRQVTPPPNAPAAAAVPAPAATPPAAAAPSPAAPVASAPQASSPVPAFPYGGPQFSQFIKTSYAEATPPAAPGTPGFYAFMERAYRKTGVRFKGMEYKPSLAATLTAIRQRYKATNDPEKRTLLEKQTGAFAFKLVKKGIRKFSLTQGFEFVNAVRVGRRQCFLQATLVSGMMQATGMNAGVVMVARNEKGEETNNGHAVALVKLSDGHDVLVDVSHKTPFIAQKGLMVADANSQRGYRYVTPQYAPGGATIVGYAPMNANLAAGNTPLTVADVRPLPVAFLVSQFDYYRGERAPGGFADTHKTNAGLAASARYLERSIQEDPRNPLAEYVLGRVYLRENKTAEARRQLVASYHLYEADGFVPSGPQQALALVGATPTAVAQR